MPLRPLESLLEPEPLWRTVAGEQLREVRRRRGETLAAVAARAGVSVQYLSEIERGRKEPSSEVLAAVVGALQLTLVDLTVAVSRELLVPSERRLGPVALAGPVASPVALAA
jgi:transcriptional regulator with XRE-family HTH domain